MKKNLKTHSVGVRISDPVYDWLTRKKKENSTFLSNQISMILEEALAAEMKKKSQ
jgi:hypothetical protein